MASRKNAPAPGLFGPDEPISGLELLATRSAGKRATRKAPVVDDRVAESLAKLPDIVERLEALIAEVPKADQFEPLAEHIYSFAQSGPRLMESLESMKDVEGDPP